jgi:glyoxylase-like metal-dependent hydrolase (beta-lactamase superfamily II)
LSITPGPTNGSIWVRLPEEKIVFVGDAVLKNQPPFLAGSNLSAWLSALDLLLSAEYKGYTIISSRGGVVTANIVKTQHDFLKHVHDKLDKVTTKKPNPAATEKLVTALLTWFKAPAARQKTIRTASALWLAALQRAPESFAQPDKRGLNERASTHS